MKEPREIHPVQFFKEGETPIKAAMDFRPRPIPQDVPDADNVGGSLLEGKPEASSAGEVPAPETKILPGPAKD